MDLRIPIIPNGRGVAVSGNVLRLGGHTPRPIRPSYEARGPHAPSYEARGPHAYPAGSSQGPTPHGVARPGGHTPRLAGPRGRTPHMGGHQPGEHGRERRCYSNMEWWRRTERSRPMAIMSANM